MKLSQSRTVLIQALTYAVDACLKHEDAVDADLTTLKADITLHVQSLEGVAFEIKCNPELDFTRDLDHQLNPGPIQGHTVDG